MQQSAGDSLRRAYTQALACFMLSRQFNRHQGCGWVPAARSPARDRLGGGATGPRGDLSRPAGQAVSGAAIEKDTGLRKVHLPCQSKVPLCPVTYRTVFFKTQSLIGGWGARSCCAYPATRPRRGAFFRVGAGARKARGRWGSVGRRGRIIIISPSTACAWQCCGHLPPASAGGWQTRRRSRR